MYKSRCGSAVGFRGTRIFGKWMQETSVGVKHVFVCVSALSWALAPDRGALGYQTGSLAARMAFRRLRGPWVQELKPSSFLRAALGCSAGMSRPAAEPASRFLG